VCPSLRGSRAIKGRGVGELKVRSAIGGRENRKSFKANAVYNKRDKDTNHVKSERRLSKQREKNDREEQKTRTIYAKKERKSISIGNPMSASAIKNIHFE